MTHLQITSVRVTTGGRDCCNGLVQAAGVGPRRHEESARSISASRRSNTEVYFAKLGGVFVDVAIGHCVHCEAPYLWANADGDLDARTENALLTLPRLDEPTAARPAAAATATPEPVPRKRRWFSL